MSRCAWTENHMHLKTQIVQTTPSRNIPHCTASKKCFTSLCSIIPYLYMTRLKVRRSRPACMHDTGMYILGRACAAHHSGSRAPHSSITVARAVNHGHTAPALNQEGFLFVPPACALCEFHLSMFRGYRTTDTPRQNAPLCLNKRAFPLCIDGARHDRI